MQNAYTDPRVNGPSAIEFAHNGDPMIVAIDAPQQASSISLCRTFDVVAVERILRDPELLPLVHDGAGISVPMADSIYHLIAKAELFADGAVDSRTIGLISFVPVNSITWTPHLALLERGLGYGEKVLNSGARWMFANTACRKLFAAPPEFKRAMIAVFQKCGFRKEGLSPASFLWHGRLYDRVLYGLEKE